MWQVVVAAAVAGSGLIAQHLSPKQQEEQNPNPESLHNYTIALDPSAANPSDESTPQSAEIGPNFEGGDGVFRFSSSGSGSGSGCKFDSRKPRVLRSKKDRNGGGEKSGDQKRKGNCGKRVSLCLKKRKIGLSSCAKRNSQCSKDCSSIGQGLGLGIMYMLTAGKAEISKLNKAMDETAKVVHELKYKLHKRKSSHAQKISECFCHLTNSKKSGEKSMIANRGSNDMKFLNLSVPDEAEYASSVLTEEPHPESTEMDQLEAELESELQKLPWHGIEASNDDDNVNEFHEQLKGFHNPAEECSISDPAYTVSPSELNQKLSQVLIKQQESHILELESELNSAYSKLQDKETELRALKDCVRRLSEFSISTASDDELEQCQEQEKILECNRDHNMGPNAKIIGTKRAMEFTA